MAHEPFEPCGGFAAAEGGGFLAACGDGCEGERVVLSGPDGELAVVAVLAVEETADGGVAGGGALGAEGWVEP